MKQEIDMNKRGVFSKKEAATFMGVSVRTVERLIASGKLAKIKIRGLVKVKRAELMNLVESGC